MKANSVYSAIFRVTGKLHLRTCVTQSYDLSIRVHRVEIACHCSDHDGQELHSIILPTRSRKLYLTRLGNGSEQF